MNLKLAKEIYGNAWFIDPLSFMQFSKILEGIHNGVVFDEKEAKSNQFGILSADLTFTPSQISRMEIVPRGTIAVYNFDSVITKGGGMSHNGTVEIAKQFTEMETNSNIIGHIFKAESGGGAVNAIKYMRDVSAKVNRKKPLVTFVEDIAASAMMYIASDSDWIIANSKDAIVGSIGTMMSLEGFKSGTEDASGKRHVRIYASQSINKNKEFEDAINDFNYDLIKSKILDPHCKDFIADMEKNRPNITAQEKTGATLKAGECIGTLIDEIGSFEMAVNKVKELSNINQKQSKMNLQELKAEHPGVYAEIFESGKNAGVSAEQNRVNTWLVFNDLDSEKVKAGIESGVEMTKPEELNFMRTSQNAALQASLESGSAEEIEANKAATKLKTKPTVEEKAVESALDVLLGSEKEDK